MKSKTGYIHGSLKCGRQDKILDEMWNGHTFLLFLFSTDEPCIFGVEQRETEPRVGFSFFFKQYIRVLLTDGVQEGKKMKWIFAFSIV